MLGRRKKSKARPILVPTELPVFDELEKRGLVVVMSERGEPAGTRDADRGRNPKKPRR
jgi:hypothetical protein